MTYYSKTVDGCHKRTQLCSSPEQGDRLMCADLERFDPFQAAEPDDDTRPTIPAPLAEIKLTEAEQARLDEIVRANRR